MNIRSRMLWKAIKLNKSSSERILSLIDFIDKYGNCDPHRKNQMKQYLRFKEFATKMMRSCPMVCNTKNKNYHKFVKVVV